MKRTKNEEWIIAYLKDKDYVSPSVIGLEHARTFGYTGAHHSCWASPICLRLVQKGVLARNDRGHYKLKQREEIASKVIDDKNREIEKLKRL